MRNYEYDEKKIFSLRLKGPEHRCFGGGGSPTPPKPPAPPKIGDAAKTASQKVRKPAGFQSTILTGGMGDSSSAPTAVKTLLGQ